MVQLPLPQFRSVVHLLLSACAFNIFAGGGHARQPRYAKPAVGSQFPHGNSHQLPIAEGLSVFRGNHIPRLTGAFDGKVTNVNTRLCVRGDMELLEACTMLDPRPDHK